MTGLVLLDTAAGREPRPSLRSCPGAFRGEGAGLSRQRRGFDDGGSARGQAPFRRAGAAHPRQRACRAHRLSRWERPARDPLRPSSPFSEGVIPNAQMTRSIGCAHDWDERAASFAHGATQAGETSVPAVFVAGDAERHRGRAGQRMRRRASGTRAADTARTKAGSGRRGKGRRRACARAGGTSRRSPSSSIACTGRAASCPSARPWSAAARADRGGHPRRGCAGKPRSRSAQGLLRVPAWARARARCAASRSLASSRMRRANVCGHRSAVSRTPAAQGRCVSASRPALADIEDTA